MKKDWFNRGVRMQHWFGETERRQDPMGVETFDPPPFFRNSGVKDLKGQPPPCEMNEYGLRPYRPDPSPIQKPSGGFAETQGKPLDEPQNLGMPFPVGTKRRLGPPRTDK